jgi:hypothetical protein
MTATVAARTGVPGGPHLGRAVRRSAGYFRDGGGVSKNNAQVPVILVL